MSKRQNYRTLFLVLVSLFLFIGIVVFSVLFLIPKGKEYRTLRLESKKEQQIIGRVQGQYDRVNKKLEKLKSDNAHTITAFKTAFDPKKFTKNNHEDFEDLYLTEIEMLDHNGSFKIYEVNATTKITSPQVFYQFLEKINKSDWIIGVNFPIYFEREGDRIKSSFTMKVHRSTI
ncbi:MAG: hypothetical protein Q8N01_02520 [Sulfuricurvum sp.]|jgi:hypothetical protein|nr:hypothetical protein [Sulfuricurvum sp.]MDP3022861.1 hypothetical protein [Sulfuricurvum sp.]MDP3119275.1 hypothetical protein [Sulfuricurvum sp.]